MEMEEAASHQPGLRGELSAFSEIVGRLRLVLSF